MKIGYCRISTHDQNLALQIDALTAAGCAKIYEETGSGAKADRVQLQEMLRSARPGDTIVVWRLDRLARSMKQLIDVVTDLAERDIEFESLTENIDTTTAGGKLVFGIFASLAEFERSLIRERTRAGLDAARERGRIGGRPKSLKKTDLIAAKALKADGMPMAEIARQLGVDRSTLYRSL